MSQTQSLDHIPDSPHAVDSFAAVFEESLKKSDMRAGEVISAEVVRIEFNHVVVNAGLKSEAYVPIAEFMNDQGEVEVQVGDFVSVAIDAIENGYGDTILSRDKAKRLASWMSLEKSLESGDFVTVAIESLEDGYGETRLSRDKAKRLKAWHDLEAAMEQGNVVSGLVAGKVKGGLTVMVNGIRAFLPGSLVDIRPVKDTSPYENKSGLLVPLANLLIGPALVAGGTLRVLDLESVDADRPPSATGGGPSA